LNSHGRITSAPLGASVSVLPSGAARLSSPSATRPAAPGLLSTITFWSSDDLMLSASSRATTSTEPPGGKPTRILTTGLSCAPARGAAATPSAAAPASRVSCLLFTFTSTGKA